jgi:succinate dehydrogenase / fumarate reductase membrane anchor subunit
MVSNVNKIPVGAHYGWKDWLAQRVTAVIMVLFSIVIIGFFMFKGSVNYADWKELFRFQLFRILTLLFLLSVYYHAWIGIKDVLMDYIKPTGLRVGLQVMMLLFLLGCSIWSVAIIWGK